MLNQEKYSCIECGKAFDGLNGDGECPHCGQKYVFPPEDQNIVEGEQDAKNKTTKDKDVQKKTNQEKIRKSLEGKEENNQEKKGEGKDKKKQTTIWGEEGINEEFDRDAG